MATTKLAETGFWFSSAHGPGRGIGQLLYLKVQFLVYILFTIESEPQTWHSEWLSLIIAQGWVEEEEWNWKEVSPIAAQRGKSRKFFPLSLV